MTERRRTSSFLVAALAVVLALAACAQQHDEPVEEAAANDTTTPGETADAMAADGIDATAVVDRAPVADAAPGFDVKAFAGTFVANGANLQLAADGTYAFTVHAESADADLTITGTWTVEDDGSALLLDPDSKDDPDQRFSIATNDELVAVVGGRVLRRDGA